MIGEGETFQMSHLIKWQEFSKSFLNIYFLFSVSFALFFKRVTAIRKWLNGLQKKGCW
jgi:hypothetical protein